ncbi:hypothetical protein BBD42_08695 [Paenibacillus sp. BIHB 4019]|uniref:Uncharacterized protein n=1 Tax=Paenibacillus sp. BIHB 4019 TaxID=1870819 RepID=A0A1B2DFS8_9BACL|nr:hypothetical protein [Paenibacillus sp. BIHB 4019]ANY66529.1 hypothetical protein BBD42_08695 [Paenibacillus sp. BIHB 4019]
MSYDLMVFEPAKVLINKEEYMVWYGEQMKWSEGCDYSDITVRSDSLQKFYAEFVEMFPRIR